MEDKYKGRKVVMTTTCLKDDSGWWTVNIHVTQARTEDLEDWDYREAEIKTIDKNLDEAINNAYSSIFIYGDLFKDSETDENKELLN